MPVYSKYSSTQPFGLFLDKLMRFYYSSFSYNSDILHLKPQIGKKAFNKNTMALNKNKSPLFYILLTLYIVSKMKRLTVLPEASRTLNTKKSLLTFLVQRSRRVKLHFAAQTFQLNCQICSGCKTLLKCAFWLHCLKRGHHAVRAEASLGASWEPCALFFTYTSHRKFAIFSVEISRCVL